MDKLQIQHIRAYNAYWYAIRFTGDTAPFNAMTSHLKKYGRYAAYWREGEFDGQGAWIVRSDILERHVHRFDNLESRMSIAMGTYERNTRAESK